MIKDGEYEQIVEAIRLSNDGKPTCSFCGSAVFSVYHISLIATLDNHIGIDVKKISDKDFYRACCVICGMEYNLNPHLPGKEG